MTLVMAGCLGFLTLTQLGEPRSRAPRDLMNRLGRRVPGLSCIMDRRREAWLRWCIEDDAIDVSGQLVGPQHGWLRLQMATFQHYRANIDGVAGYVSVLGICPQGSDLIFDN
jgi:hypothetical protein